MGCLQMAKGKCASDRSSCGLFIINNDPANCVSFFKGLFSPIGRLHALES